MSRIADLELRFLHKELSTTNGTPAVRTADSGTARSFVDAALTQTSDYWNGALVRWDSGPNAALWSSVHDFVASTDTVLLDDDLPNAIASGHTYTLFHGGKHASDQRVPGLKTSPLVNVVGFTIAYAAALNGEGTGTIRYYDAAKTVTWQPPGGLEGAEVDVSGLVEDDVVVLTSGSTDPTTRRSEFVQLVRTDDALPAGDEEDDVSLDLVPGSFLARVTGAESNDGVTYYRAAAVRNVGADAITGVRTYGATPFVGAAGTTLAEDLGTGVGTLEAASLTNWGTSGWVLNVDKNDVRYFHGRSGNSASVLSPGSGMRGKTAVAWDDGDELVPLPWFDVGLDAPGTASVFEDPATRETAPSGVTFSCPTEFDDGLSLGTIAAGGVYCIWLRFQIPADARPVEGGRVDLRFIAEVTGG